MSEVIAKVNLKQKDGGKGPKKEQKFPIDQANKLLSLKKTQWQLSDDRYKWNGTELAKNAK